jgi:hypothetical protein
MTLSFRLAVLNPGGRDPEQHFPDGAGNPDAPRTPPHPPVNYHAYAACVGGAFYADSTAALATGDPVLLLLRRDLKPGWRCLQRLKAAGRTVAVTFKEAGAMQVAARLTSPADLRLLESIVALADGCLSPTPWLAEFFRGMRPASDTGGAGKDIAFIPTPYSVDDPRWDFSAPLAQRRGIFVGTREPETASRQHLAALLAARRLHTRTGEPVTVFNTDGRRGAKWLSALGFAADGCNGLRMVTGPVPYTVYLREMAKHKLVFQLDRSAVPGQVAGDALLCGLPCVGGDGAVETLAFPAFSGVGREPAALVELAASLLTDSARYEQACGESRELAMKTLSYRAIAARLAAFFEGLPKN